MAVVQDIGLWLLFLPGEISRVGYYSSKMKGFSLQEEEGFVHF